MKRKITIFLHRVFIIHFLSVCHAAQSSVSAVRTQPAAAGPAVRRRPQKACTGAETDQRFNSAVKSMLLAVIWTQAGLKPLLRAFLAERIFDHAQQ